MTKLKEILKKPAIAWGISGAIGLGMGILALTNIGLKNQNYYLFNKYVETGKLYTDLVVKQINLREDTLKNSIKHSSEIIYLKRKNIQLNYKIDSLQNDYKYFAERMIGDYTKLDLEKDSLLNDYINFAEGTLEVSKERRSLFETIISLTQERDFYKKYSETLDSMLRNCESNKIFQEIKPPISFKNSP